MYKLRGYDPFSREYYNLDGEYSTYLEALGAARKRLAELEVEQPSEQTGGQDGIQDQVYVLFPDWRQERVR